LNITYPFKPKQRLRMAFTILLGLSILQPSLCFGDIASILSKKIGANDAVLVADPDGKVLFSKNADKKRVPASTLKIFTALFSLETLGPDFRFQTEFYLDNASNLIIKGYGDPLIVSEAVREIAKTLKEKMSSYNDLVLDDSYFENPVAIPGVTSSLQPYDAPNGALCVNFNTVNFKRKKDGTYVSAEPQTPLLPFVMKKVKTSKLKKGRIIFSQKRHEITLYAGHLFRHFLSEAGINQEGRIRLGKVPMDTARLVYRHSSRFTLEEILSRLMEHSNNFTANQVLIAAGAKISDPPGTLDKGVRAAKHFAGQKLGLDDFEIVEGSGISRKNRISADMMLIVLRAFYPYRLLLRHEDGVYFKTGTLYGVSTRAGYLEGTGGRMYPFVIFLNSRGKSAEKIVPDILKMLE
jgi:serine-type D-Ala-D-Ala carboxypeptidase/endopeptidase (penicillin-binding protein 4)